MTTNRIRVRTEMSVRQQTIRDWQNVKEAVLERPFMTAVSVAITLVIAGFVAAFLAAPWLMD